MKEFYSIPFSFADLLGQKKGQYRCNLHDSIRQYISLIITTKFEHFRYDPSFGCKIWDVDFVVPSNLNTWKDEIKEALKEAILNNEHRIDQVSRFEVTVKKTGLDHRINQRLDIDLECTIKGTNEICHYTETLYFSPYSLV